MTTQIAVRLPDDLVEYVDAVARTEGGSRAAIVRRALVRLRQSERAEADARILEQTGDYDDFAGIAAASRFED